MARERVIKRLPKEQPTRWQRFIAFFQNYLPFLCGTVEIAAIVAEDIILPAPEAAKANIATEVAVAGLEAAASTGLNDAANIGKKDPQDHKEITKVADQVEAAGHTLVDLAKVGTEVATSIALGNLGTSGLETQVVANAAIETAAKALNDGVDVAVSEGEDLAVRFVDRYLSSGKEFVSAREL